MGLLNSIERVVSTGISVVLRNDKPMTIANIIIEDKARNTVQNIEYSIAKLKADFNDLNSLNSINKAVLTSDFHLRRASGMLEQQLRGEVFRIGAKDGKTDFDHWFTNPYGRYFINKEAMLIVWCVKHNIETNFSISKPNRLVRKRKY